MITIDKRVGSADLLQFLPSGVAALRRLDFGDACFIGNGKDGIPVTIGIERKRLPDLVGSLESGRFSGHQLPGLLASYNIVYLIVEGLSRVRDGQLVTKSGNGWKETGLSALAFDNYLNTLEVMAGVIVRQTYTAQRTAHLIYHLYQWWSKGWDQHKSHLVFYEPRPTMSIVKPSLVRRVAKELPGIGWARSGPVSEYFPTVRRMIIATEAEWAGITGIGKGLANRVVEAIGG